MNIRLGIIALESVNHFIPLVACGIKIHFVSITIISNSPILSWGNMASNTLTNWKRRFMINLQILVLENSESSEKNQSGFRVKETLD